MIPTEISWARGRRVVQTASVTGALVVDVDGVVLLRDVAHRETLEIGGNAPGLADRIDPLRTETRWT